MAIIGVLHLTPIANLPTLNQTPATALLSHLSDLYPTETHVPFTLDHRLFISTSSLLPHTDSKRTFTHLFTSSRTPGKTYLGTTSLSNSATVALDATESKSPDSLNTITIPTSSSLEPFTALLSQKLQPQWAPRQFLVLDNGASVALPITDDAKWKISIGDLRLSPSRVSGSAAGQLRGLILELEYESGTTNLILDSEDKRKKYEVLFRALLKSLFKKVNLELKLDEAKIYLVNTATKATVDNEHSENAFEDQHQNTSKPPGYEIAELYMEALRGSRG